VEDVIASEPVTDSGDSEANGSVGAVEDSATSELETAPSEQTEDETVSPEAIGDDD
ncbi:MAG: hypothetical protein IIC24_01850, partial [Chloroflexi bacterium]|nr:hypothetical protein [Chloroflexota bacterium]